MGWRKREQTIMKLHNYQKKFLELITSGGAKPGEMIIAMGRQTGKSMFTQKVIDEMMQARQMESYKASDPVLVDGEPWYTLKCKTEVAAWIRTQDKSMWYEHVDKNWYVYRDRFDVHEKLLTFISIKFEQ